MNPATERAGADPSRTQAGFSLLEVLVSSIVVSLVAVSAFYFLGNQNKQGIRGGDMVKGVNFGKQKMDSLKVLNYDALASGSDTVSDRYVRSWSISQIYDELGNPIGQKSIEVAVRWPLTGDQNVYFNSVKSDDKYRDPNP
jgi:prepilin-type N-terminal cleavage/methylation domain-containing protein